MNKRLTKVASFALLVLLTLGEGSQFVYAVTEESTSSTAANEKVLPAKDTVDSAEKTATSSSEVATEETTSSSEEATTESTTEASEDKEKKKEKSKATRAADTPVNIPDPNLNDWIRKTLNYPYGLNQGIADTDPVTEAHMEMLKTLKRGSYDDPENKPISDLTGLEYAVNLETLDFHGSYELRRKEDKFDTIPDFFKKFTKLSELKFYYGEISNIDALKNHPTLQKFSIERNELTSLKGLSGCKELTFVNVSGSVSNGETKNFNIQNFEGLEDATKLRGLYYTKTDYGHPTVGPTDPEPSYVGHGLQSLKGLNCANTLEVLDLMGHPGLATLDGLENYTALTTLNVRNSSGYNGRNYYYDNPGSVTALLFDPATHTPTTRTRGLRGPNAISALSNCSALKTVNLSYNAIENVDALAGKASIESLNISNNLITTLTPLKTSINIVTLNASGNLLTDLSGLENMDVLKELNVSAQSGGAVRMTGPSGLSDEYYLCGLLSDISAINPKSLVTLDITNNRLESLSSLNGATKLTELSASNNKLSDIKGHLNGCSSIEKVNFSNNKFVHFKDTGLDDASNSLKVLNMSEQGLRSLAKGTNSNNEKALLESLDGLEHFSVLKELTMPTNQLKDEDMIKIPNSIEELDVSHNELQDKAFQSFDPIKMTKLKKLTAGYNHISDITPLEAFSGSTLTRVHLRGQSIGVPEDGGTKTIVSTPNNGYEIDVLKTNYSSGLAFKRYADWGTATPSVKPATNILLMDDPNYEREGKTTIANFSYTGNSTISDFIFDGRINFDVDYGIATTANLELVPTDFDGNEITEISQGGIIYWRAKAKGTEAQYLMKPNFGYNLQSTQHQILDPYVEPIDSQATEYIKGARIEMGGVHIPTPSGLWGQEDLLHNRLNKDNMVDVTVVTKVNDDATVGNNVNMYLYFKGLNFPLTKDTKTVKVKAKVPEVINLSVPDRFDFGKGNEATKKMKLYKPDAKAYSTTEQTDGFNVRVTDTRQGSSRTDWKVVAQLSDLTNSKSTALKAGSVAPTLSLRDISLYKMDLGTGTESSIGHGTIGNPSWDQNILITAGGPSVSMSKAHSANGEGVWDYRIPFDKVELTVPANVNEQAGYTFKGKLTWTLDNTL